MNSYLNPLLSKGFYLQLNKIIQDQGYVFGPSQLALILQGPIDKKRISNENLKLLSNTQILVRENYQKHILPKIAQVVSPLTNFKGNFPKRKDLESKLIVLPFDEVRDEMKHLYREYKDFEIETETQNNLFSTRKLKNNDFVRFGFDFKQGFIFSTRLKKEKSISKKIYDKYAQLTSEEKLRYCDFVLDACNLSQDYWTKDCQEMMINEYLEGLNRLMINDYMGLKIVEFNQNRATKNLDRIANLGPSIKVDGFYGICSRFDDHREDKLKSMPGGVHLTFIDSGHTNYPIEVQYLDSESSIFDMFGPNSHDLYVMRGKTKKRN